MGFGGSVFAMIQSLRANARPKHKAFQNWTKTENRIYQTNRKLFAKKVSPEKLAEIKENNKKEIEIEQNRSLIIKTATILVLIPLIVLVVFHFFFKTTQENYRPYQAEHVETESVTKQIKDLLNSGYEWLNKNHYKNARFQFKRVLEIHPNNKAAIYGLTASYVYECQIDKTNCDKAQQLIKSYVSKFEEDTSIKYLEDMLETQKRPAPY